MKLSDIDEFALRTLLKKGELLIGIAPFVARLRSDVPRFSRDLALMYGQFPVSAPDSFADFHTEVALDTGLRRWFKPLARFAFDGRRAFSALPASQAFAMMEWGLNWCVAAHAHQYLVIHAAVIEKHGKGVMLPAPPGSGKSTLCAGLVNRGWRLLSDELALCDMDTGLIYGMSRPVNLKNRSIDVVKEFAPDAVMTEPVQGTVKGTVALMRPPDESVRRASEPVRINWVVLPEYTAGAAASMVAYPRARAFMLIAEQTFNYEIQGAQGFHAIGRLLDRCQSYKFKYSSLHDAAEIFEDFASNAA